MSTTWDPQQYLRFADQRSRPFHDLLSRVAPPGPRTVVDLGCGPGNMTVNLADRWPDATVVGVDISEEMIATASAHSRPGRLSFQRADLTTWAPDHPVDVIVCAATLHWVPGHLELIPRLAGFLAPGGFFAFQVPGNFVQPSHVLLRELARSDRWQDLLSGTVDDGPFAHEPLEYLQILLDLPGEAGVEVWETTYHHVLSGPDPVLDWVKGTALRPVLDVLRGRGAETEAEFLASYAAVLRAAYPTDAAGRTVFPFRRIFGVVQSAQD